MLKKEKIGHLSLFLHVKCCGEINKMVPVRLFRSTLSHSLAPCCVNNDFARLCNCCCPLCGIYLVMGPCAGRLYRVHHESPNCCSTGAKLEWKWSRSVVSDSLQPRDCSPPDSSFHWILQARTLEWVAISFSRGSSWPRDRTQVSHIAGRCFNLWATWEAPDWSNIKVMLHEVMLLLLLLLSHFSRVRLCATP